MASKPPVIAALEHRGGPILGAMKTDELQAFLQPFGLSLESTLAGDALRSRHFGDEVDALRVSDVFGLVRAVRD